MNWKIDGDDNDLGVKQIWTWNRYKQRFLSYLDSRVGSFEDDDFGGRFSFSGIFNCLWFFNIFLRRLSPREKISQLTQIATILWTNPFMLPIPSLLNTIAFLRISAGKYNGDFEECTKLQAVITKPLKKQFLTAKIKKLCRTLEQNNIDKS